MNQISLSYNIYMTIEEYALHVKISGRKVTYLIKQGLPSVKTGRTRRIIWQKADEWLLQTSSASNKPQRKPRAKRPESQQIPETLATCAPVPHTPNAA